MELLVLELEGFRVCGFECSRVWGLKGLKACGFEGFRSYETKPEILV